MPNKSEDRLRRRAEEYIKLLSVHGFRASIVPNSYREYHVKVTVEKNSHVYGPVLIYCTDKNESYSAKWHEMRDKSIVPELEAIWYQKPESVGESLDNKEIDHSENGYDIYTDGSYKAGDTKIGFAALILKSGKILHTIQNCIDDISQNQILGEIAAVRQAIQWCTEHQVYDVNIYYDYKGLECWATGVWQAKTLPTRQYVEYIHTCGVKIAWHKVEGHSGDRWNEQVDKLAREAVTVIEASENHQAELYEPVHDLVAKLTSTSQQFVNFLNQHGQQATLRGIFNGNCAQISVIKDNLPIGRLNIYHTSKRPFHITFHELRASAEDRAKYQRLWDEYMGKASPNEAMAQVDYYYNILKPFADCRFDFGALAESAHRCAVARGLAAPALENLRYDFRSIEALIGQLKQP